MGVTTAKLSFCVAATGSDLRLTAKLNDVLIYDDSPGTEPVIVQHDFDDTLEQEYLLVFEMQGKLSEHTQIDRNGNILEDRCIIIRDISLDGIELGHKFTELGQYHHDTNGTTGLICQPFHGTMGCNGRVEMAFSTPIYLWLL